MSILYHIHEILAKVERVFFVQSLINTFFVVLLFLNFPAVGRATDGGDFWDLVGRVLLGNAGLRRCINGIPMKFAALRVEAGSPGPRGQGSCVLIGSESQPPH